MTDEAVDYAATLLTETREEVTRADAKASLLLAATGVGVSALIGGVLRADWSPANLPVGLRVLWWLGLAFGALGVTSLGISVYPRTRRKGKSTVRAVNYYNDVVSFRSVDDLADALSRSDRPRVDRLADQIWQLGRIVERKYKHIRRGMWFIAIAILLCGGSPIIAVALG